MSYLVLLPEALVVATAMVALLVGRLTLIPAASRRYLALVTAAIVIVAFGVELWAGAALTTYFGGALVQDRFALFAKAAALLIAAVAIATTDWAAEDSLYLGLAMPLVAAFGVMVAASAADMIGLWAGLELAAAAAVVMVSLRRPDLGLRLLVVGAVASSLVLIGLAFLYASTGNADLTAIRDVIANRTPTLALAIPMLLLLGGLAIRAGIAPFHVGPLPVGLGASPLGAGLVIGFVTVAAATVGIKLVAALAPIPSVYAPYAYAISGVAMVGGGAAALAVRSPRPRMAYLAVAQLGWVAAGLATHFRLPVDQPCSAGRKRGRRRSPDWVSCARRGPPDWRWPCSRWPALRLWRASSASSRWPQPWLRAATSCFSASACLDRCSASRLRSAPCASSTYRARSKRPGGERWRPSRR